MAAPALLTPDQPGICALTAGRAAAAHSIVSEAVLVAPGLRVTRFRFAAGQELAEHTSTARALVQVLAGECEFTVGGATHRMKAGDLLHLPPRAPHAARAVAELTLLLTQAG